jgi:hypothetical protein
MRRAMSCVYCAPKSRMTMHWLRADWFADFVAEGLACGERDCEDLVGTNEFLRFA